MPRNKKRIGIFEWASCIEPHQRQSLPESIRTEGWLMLQAALKSAAAAGLHGVSIVASDLLKISVGSLPTNTIELQPLKESIPYETQWLNCFRTCDRVLVIAPECDGILESQLRWFERHKIATCNADLHFTTLACDKWQSAVAWRELGISHPSTRLLCDADPHWLSEHCDPNETSHVVLKPRYGVGCDGIERIDAAMALSTIDRYRAERDGSQWIVQPWLEGMHCSRSAIVSSDGQCHWLPATQQRLEISQSIRYLGGTVRPKWNLEATWFTKCVNALRGRPCGWVGIDFLLRSGTKKSEMEPEMVIIEMNPRLTTSFLGLSQAGCSDLVGAVFNAAEGLEVVLPDTWQPTDFSAD